MSENKLPRPTGAELQILQLLWEYGPNPVRFINEKLNKKREIGYTTTLKLLQIMHEKGLVQRNTNSRSHIYEAILSMEETQQSLLENFVDKVFSGSAMSLVLQALGNNKASKAELDEIKAMIEKMEEQ